MRNQRGNVLAGILIGSLLILSIMLLAVAVVRNTSLFDKDSTDPVDGRSGMVLYVDAATGCNYLSSGRHSGITPRLRPDGSLWCDAPAQRAQ